MDRVRAELRLETAFSKRSSLADTALGYSHRPNTANATPTTVAATKAASNVATNAKAILPCLAPSGSSHFALTLTCVNEKFVLPISCGHPVLALLVIFD